MVYLNGNRIVPSHGKLNDRHCGIRTQEFPTLVHIPLFLVQS